MIVGQTLHTCAVAITAWDLGGTLVVRLTQAIQDARARVHTGQDPRTVLSAITRLRWSWGAQSTDALPVITVVIGDTVGHDAAIAFADESLGTAGISDTIIRRHAPAALEVTDEDTITGIIIFTRRHARLVIADICPDAVPIISTDFGGDTATHVTGLQAGTLIIIFARVLAG